GLIVEGARLEQQCPGGGEGAVLERLVKGGARVAVVDAEDALVLATEQVLRVGQLQAEAGGALAQRPHLRGGLGAEGERGTVGRRSVAVDRRARKVLAGKVG